MKNAERGHRETSNLKFKTIVGSQTMRQYGAFLSNSSNKAELVRFLVSRWNESHACIQDTQVFVAFDETCSQVGVDEAIDRLRCNHEEADTRMLFYAKDINSTFNNIIIYTPDTDVFIIAMGASTEIFIRTGTLNKSRIISLPEVKQQLAAKYQQHDFNKVSKALVGLRGFTGCGTISAFSGKGLH